ncbi:hypothetical protein WC29P3_00036 [Weissella phage WC29P3]|nr:hypothetical protein WC29P3_00036 [Weissella phage WC29P3]
MYFLEITNDMETTEPVELTTEFEGHAVKVIGYKVADDWRNAYRIDEREYDGDTDDLTQDLNYIKGELQKLLTGDYMAIWTKD